MQPAIVKTFQVTKKIEKMQQLERFNETIDYLKSPLTSSFFELEEGFAYLGSLLANQARENYWYIKKSINQFLENLKSEDDFEIIDNIIKTQNGVKIDKNDLPNNQIELKDKLKELNPTGFSLLNPILPITCSTLKEAYRKAALKYHPDKGGSEESMKIINESLVIFEKIIQTFQYSGSADILAEEENESGDQGKPLITNVSDYVSYVYAQMVFILTDEYDLINAFNWLVQLHEKKIFNREKFIQMQELRKCNNCIPWESLANGLFTANKKTDAQKVLDIAKDFGYTAEYFGCRTPLRIKLTGSRLRHIQQIENAYKLKLISDEKYLQLKRKWFEERAEKEHILGNFLKEPGFIRNLPTEKNLKRKNSEKKFILQPYYFTDVDLLDSNQQAEYADAFQVETISVRLVDKYRKIRIQSLLKSLVIFKKIELIDHIIQECKLIQKITHKGVYYYCQDVIDLCSFFKSLDLPRLKKRVEILSWFHERSRVRGCYQETRPEFTAFYCGEIFCPDKSICRRYGKNPFVVHLYNDSFFKFAKHPDKILERMYKKRIHEKGNK